MEFAIGCAVGVAVSWLVVYLCRTADAGRLLKVERQVEKLYRHLACGQGYIGCTGGPRCSSDHK